MSDEDPVPLRAGGEAAPELVRVLYALRELEPDAARRAHIASNLRAALEAAPPPRAASTLTRIKALLTRITLETKVF